MKSLTFFLVVCLLSACGTTSKSSDSYTWVEITAKLDQLNEQYEYSQVNIEAIPAEEKQKMLNMKKADFDLTLQSLAAQQAEDDERLRALSLQQQEKVTYYEQYIQPKLMEAKSTAEFHRLVLEYADHCDPNMVERAKAFLAAQGDQNN